MNEPGAPLQTIAKRYRVIGEIVGRGANAVVYRVEDNVTQQELALKQLTVTSDDADFDDTVALFQREYHVLAQLRHRCIVQAFDYGIDAGQPYYTMELVQGRELRELGAVDVTHACTLLRDVAAALAVLHAHRWVHRDLSTRNVLCMADGHGKLIDFGAMVPMGVPEDATGTPPFVSPEGWRGEALDGRADLYALGGLAYLLLTGRHAYAAPQLSDLPELWRTRPADPCQLRPEIPKALGELTLSLLALDRSRRPADAAEVCHRLTAIAGLAPDAGDERRDAHLHAPKLVGRDLVLKEVRKRALLLRRHGAALWFEAAPGMGRSRILDACVLEGQVVGALPVRLGAGHCRPHDYALIRALTRALLQLLPEPAIEAATPVADVLGHVLPELWEAFGKPMDTTPAPERTAVQRALRSWLAAVSLRQALFIAIDDVHLADEPSLSVLALLARSSNEHRVALAISATLNTPHDLSALALLRSRCTHLPLLPLRDVETLALVQSMFGAGPGVTALATQLHRVSEGNPGTCVTLAQHLLEQGVVQRTSAGFSVPELTSAIGLPRSTEEAYALRVARLQPDALQLAQAMCLSDCQLSPADYLALTAHGDPRRLYAALDELTVADIIVGSGRGYRICHAGIAMAIDKSLDLNGRTQHGLRLAALLRTRGSDAITLSHHLLEAGQTHEAIDLLLHEIRASAGLPMEIRPANLRYVRDSFERCIAACVASDRPVQDTLELRVNLVGLSMFVDPLIVVDHSAAIERVLLNDASELDPVVSLEMLGRYALFALAPSATMLDTPRLRALVALTERVSALGGIFEIIHDVAKATLEIAMFHNDRADEIYLRVLQRLSGSDGEALAPTVRHHFRLGILYVLGQSYASRTDPVIEEWIAELDADPLHQINAWRVRWQMHTMRGEVGNARIDNARIEALVLESGQIRTLDGGTAYTDFRMALATRNLGDIKATLVALDALATRYPAYRAIQRCSLGMYLALSGDMERGRHELQSGLDLLQPDHDAAWSTAIDDYLWVRYECDGATTVAPLIEQALRTAENANVDGRQLSRLSSLLALCEAELGEHASALSRIDAAVAMSQQHARMQRAEVMFRAAHTALAAGDDVRFGTFARDCAELCQLDQLPGWSARYEELMQLGRSTRSTVVDELAQLAGDSTQRAGTRKTRRPPPPEPD